jgi:hypothetical protein
MEKKKIESKLISIGLILYLVSFLLFGLADTYWNFNYLGLIYEASFWLKAPTILGFIIGGIIYIIAIIFIVIGGLRVKIKIDYWFVLVGLLLFGNSSTLLLIFRYFNSFWIYLIPYEVFYALLMIAVGGIVSVIIGGLMKPFERRKDIKV